MIAPSSTRFSPGARLSALGFVALLLSSATSGFAKTDAAGCRAARLIVHAGSRRTAEAIRLKNACISALSLGHNAAGTAGQQLRLAETRVVLFSGATQIADLDETSASYHASLNTQNYGSYSWTYVNNTGAAQPGVKALAFLDADIDISTNGYANEYGAFVSLALPPSAPGGTFTASSWEIDEPGYVYGDIYHNLYAGALDNSNGVPSSAPDDVSMALGFAVGQLNPGDSVTVTLYLSQTNIGGLEQTDPNSPLSIYYNGNAQVAAASSPPPPPPIGIPAANTVTLAILALLLAGAAVFFMRRVETQ